MIACFCKRRNQNSYKIHEDEPEKKDENDIKFTKVAHQSDSSIKKKQDEKTIGFSNPIFTDIDDTDEIFTDENILDTCSKIEQSLNEVKSFDILDIKDFSEKDNHELLCEK